MESDIPSFEKDLWGQYNKLHERLLQKKKYYKNLKKAFDPIYNSIVDLDKKLQTISITMDPTISVELYTDSEALESNSDEKGIKWYGFSLTMKLVKDFIDFIIDNIKQALSHVVKNLEQIIKIMKKEKYEFRDFQKCLNNYSDSKKTMDKNMRLYHQKMSAAEQSVIDLKKIEVRNMNVLNNTVMLESKGTLDNKANQLNNDAKKPFNIYKESVEKANNIRKESIDKQKNLLLKYQNIEEEIGKLNSTISTLFISSLKIQKECNEQKSREFEKIKNNVNINTNRDIKQLINHYRGNEKPEKEIRLNYFPSVIDFNKTDTNENFEIDLQTVEYIKEINKEEYPNFDKDLEIKKNDMRIIMYSLFENFDEEKKNKLLEYIEDKRVYVFFLIVLSKLRTNNRFKQEEILINLLGVILNKILDVSEKEKLYDNAKNCIILSQTFFFSKDNIEKNYLMEKIKKHKWLVSPDFWVNFIERAIDIEIDKFLSLSGVITKEDILNNHKDLNDKIKSKLSELLFSQLLPYVNNMVEFKLDLKTIVFITEKFISKYQFIQEEHKESIFGLISNNKEQIEKYRKEYKNSNDYKLSNEKNNINNTVEKKINNKININKDNIENNNIIRSSTMTVNKNCLKDNTNKSKINPNSSFCIQNNNDKNKNKFEGVQIKTTKTLTSNVNKIKIEDKKENKTESTKNQSKIASKKEEAGKKK